MDHNEKEWAILSLYVKETCPLPQLEHKPCETTVSYFILLLPIIHSRTSLQSLYKTLSKSQKKLNKQSTKLKRERWVELWRLWLWQWCWWLLWLVWVKLRPFATCQLLVWWHVGRRWRLRTPRHRAPCVAWRSRAPTCTVSAPTGTRELWLLLALTLILPWSCLRNAGFLTLQIARTSLLLLLVVKCFDVT